MTIKLSRAFAIIPAAGSGERMRLPQSKLLCQISGKSILRRTLESFSQTGLFERIFIPCRDIDREQFAEAAKELDTAVEFITGGMTRQQSVKLALEYIYKLDNHQKLLVAVHDAARCFVSKDLIERCVNSARLNKAVTAAIPCVDTIYTQTENACIALPLLDRSRLRSIQTPQVFSFELLWKAHNDLSIESSDDAGLVAQIHPVTLVEGEILNFKITTTEDLRKAAIFA